MVSPDKEFVEARQERYRNAHNRAEVESFVPWFADDTDYSDHGLGVAHINKEQVKELAVSVFASVTSMEFTTISVNGTKEFSAWEWTAKGTIAKEIPGVPYKLGEEFKMMGATLTWWNLKDTDVGSIKMMAEYSKFL